MASEKSRINVEMADALGGVVVPSIVAAAYGIYRLAFVDMRSSNGLILTVLGSLSLISAWLFQFRASVVAPWLLGWYTFGILGCIGFGIAIAERSGIAVAAGAMFWLLFGWYALNRVSRFRRFRMRWWAAPRTLDHI